MKNMKIILPAVITAIFVLFLYQNITRNAEISHIEHELTELRLLSHELKTDYVTNNNTLENLSTSIDNDAFALSNMKYNTSVENYLHTLSISEHERLYSLVKVIRSKNDLLKNVYEDIKTDNAALKSSITWAKKAYKRYMKNKKAISEDDRRYLNHLFDVTIGSSTTSAKDFKYITSLKNTDLLNKHLKMIYHTKLSLNNSMQELKRNDIRYEVNQVIKYSHELSTKLHEGSSTVVQNLLYAALLLLVAALGIYIKELKDAKELEKTKNELNDFYNALNESSIVSKSDLQGKIIYVNDRFCEISGYSKEELLGKPHSIVRHPSTDSEIFKELWETIQANKIFKGIIKNRKKDGSMYIVDTTVIPLHNEDGEIIEYLSVRYDLTHTLHMVL